MYIGSIIKTIMYYDKPYWRQSNKSGEVFDPSPSSPVVYCIDDTKPDGSFPAIMGFVSGIMCRTLQSKTKQERMRIIQDHYAKVLGIKQEPIGYTEKNWCSEPFAGGCYMGVAQPGTVTSFYPSLRESIRVIGGGIVHFAGTETAFRWAGYMDGAVEAGYRAASAVLQVPFDYQDRERNHLIPGDPVSYSRAEKLIPSFGVVVKASVTAGAALLTNLFIKAKL